MGMMQFTPLYSCTFQNSIGFLPWELHAGNQQTLCPAAVHSECADLHLGQQGIRARPVLTQILAEVQ